MGIPLLIEALVHGENPVRNARGKEQFFLLEFQIDKHSRNVLRGKRTVGRKQCPFQILRGEQYCIILFKEIQAKAEGC